MTAAMDMAHLLLPWTGMSGYPSVLSRATRVNGLDRFPGSRDADAR